MMYRSHSYTSGVVPATLLAGPLFLLGLILASWSGDMSMVVVSEWEPSTIPRLLPVVLLAMVPGVAISVFPNFLGTKLMKALGKYNPAMQLPIAWALVGGLVSGLPFVLTASGQDDVTPLARAFIFTGTICALICHRNVTWDEAEPEPLSARRSPAICT